MSIFKNSENQTMNNSFITEGEKSDEHGQDELL